MNDLASPVDRPQWHAASLINEAVQFIERHAGYPWGGYELTADKLTEAWNILLRQVNLGVGKDATKQAMALIDTAMQSLASIRGEVKLLLGHTATCDIGDVKLELGDYYPKEIRAESIEGNIQGWLEEFCGPLRAVAAALRVEASEPRRDTPKATIVTKVCAILGCQRNAAGNRVNTAIETGVLIETEKGYVREDEINRFLQGLAPKRTRSGIDKNDIPDPFIVEDV